MRCDSGVPQGSSLGQLLLVVYVSPVVDIIIMLGMRHNPKCVHHNDWQTSDGNHALIMQSSHPCTEKYSTSYAAGCCKQCCLQHSGVEDRTPSTVSSWRSPVGCMPMIYSEIFADFMWSRFQDRNTRSRRWDLVCRNSYQLLHSKLCSRATRSADQQWLQDPRSRTDTFTRAFQIYAPAMWNNLPLT